MKYFLTLTLLLGMGLSTLEAQDKLPKKTNQNLVRIEQWPGVYMDQMDMFEDFQLQQLRILVIVFV